MRKRIIPGIALLILISGVILFVYHDKPDMKRNETDKFSSGGIIINNLGVGSKISSPLNIEGVAPGNWYFEASFPIKVTDENGNILGQTPAQAQSDWMTTSSVPFKAVLEFSTSTTPTGFLVLSKDNPSGLPQNSSEIKFQINFR